MIRRAALYLLKMLPFMLAAAAVFIAVRVRIVKKKKNAVSAGHETALLLFTAYCAGLASVTIIPESRELLGFGGTENISLIPFYSISEMLRAVSNGHYELFITNFVGNVIVFVPIGILLPAAFGIGFPLTAACGAGISFVIEFCQLFVGRTTDIDDIILNTLGCAAGYFVFSFFRLVYRLVKAFFKKHIIQ